jgi:hypothetical protein
MATNTVQTDRQPMQPRLQELFAYLKVRRNALREAVDAVPEAQRSQPPEPVAGHADVLEHLALVEGRFTTTLGNRLAEARAQGLAEERETSPIVGTFDQAAVLDRTNRREAPEVVRPQGLDWKSAWSRLEDTRRSFLDVYLSADGLALTDVVRPPAPGVVESLSVGRLDGRARRTACRTDSRNRSNSQL